MQQTSAAFGPRTPLAVALALVLAACAQFRPHIPPSEGHITAPQVKAEPEKAIPPPARVSTFVPPPKPAVKPQTYSVVVTEVPVKDLLLALARDTKQNIDIHPGLTGVVSLNAINETLLAILDRISKQVALRYRQIGNTLVVTPDEPFTKTYQINYVNMTRNSTSLTTVSGRIGGAAGAQGGAAAGSTTTVTTTTENAFWKSLETDLRGIILSSQNQSAQAKADREALFRTLAQIRLQETRAAPAAALGAAKPLGGGPEADSISGAGAALANLKPVESVLINPITGTVTVSGTESQHNLVQDYLTQVQAQAQRQVLIEATIVEVKLSDQYQAGVDWSRLAISGGVTFNQTLLGGNIGIPPTFAIGYANPTSRIGNIAAAIRLLEQFGNTRVLSSPKLMAMNNQTALLKVTDDITYFTIAVTAPTFNPSGGILTQAVFTTTPATIEVGVVMSLTPQINENGQIMLGIRPSITRLLSFVNDPNPELARAGVVSPIPQLQKREMESILQLTSGQTAVLGGLMQDSTQYNRDAVPWVGNPAKTGIFSELFGFRNDQVTKTELVIFLRPTIIANPTLESDELRFFQRFLPQPETQPEPEPKASTLPQPKTGAAR